jgi:hypothetical protein
LTVGVALFATFAGFLAKLFLEPKAKRDDANPTLDEFRALLDRQEETTAQLRSKLEQLEATSQSDRAASSGNPANMASVRTRGVPSLTLDALEAGPGPPAAEHI